MIQYRCIHQSTEKNGKHSHSFLGAVARVLRRRLAVLALIAGVGTWAPNAQAASLQWAYLWADQPSPPSDTNSTCAGACLEQYGWTNQTLPFSYTPAPSYQFNSSGATNTVERTNVGMYTAKLPNLGAVAGTVHVTAYGGESSTCKVANWGPDPSRGSTQQVNVRCFTSAGVPADTRFTMTYTHPFGSWSGPPLAFLMADQPLAASYTPYLPYQFNSSGATNTVVRTGVGMYMAKLPNLGGATGHVQVTAYGGGSARCKVASWAPSGSTQLVNVRCFTSAGAPADTQFTMTYVSGISLVGSPCCSAGLGTASAYAWANQFLSPSYTPDPSYQFNSNSSGATNTVTRSGVGVYGVQFPYQSLVYGDVQVTAYGSGSEYCKVASWTPKDGVQVRCFSSSGVAVDTYFDVTFLESRVG